MIDADAHEISLATLALNWGKSTNESPAAEHIARGHLLDPPDCSGVEIERDDRIGCRLRRRAVGIARRGINDAALDVDRRR